MQYSESHHPFGVRVCACVCGRLSLWHSAAGLPLAREHEAVGPRELVVTPSHADSDRATDLQETD
jgi:hypothetical protein